MSDSAHPEVLLVSLKLNQSRSKSLSSRMYLANVRSSQPWKKTVIHKASIHQQNSNVLMNSGKTFALAELVTRDVRALKREGEGYDVVRNFCRLK